MNKRNDNIRTSPALTAGIFLLALVAASCGKDGVEYRTEPVTRGDIRETVTATGTVNPVTTVQVGTQVSGTIKDIFVDFNSLVRKGQLIAQIDPAFFETQLAQSRANADRALAALRDAERVLNQNKALYPKHLIAKNDYDASVTAQESAAAQVAQALAALKAAETNLSYTKIFSPVDGVVISRNVDVGQTVAASFQTPTLFTIAQDLTKMQINTNVAESDIGRVQVGQAVEFIVDAYPDTNFKGSVRQVRRAPITVQNVVTYDVVVQVPNPGMKLMPGMTANVAIVITTKDEVLRIPNSALRFRPERSADQAAAKPKAAAEKKGPAGPSVWVQENNKPKRVAVTTGISDGIWTEVVSGELKEDQQVIVETVKKNKGASQSGPPRMF
ncbi:MAG: efflux RND transporter periplasmic adaptor subunit [Nitrospirota bacterium]|nr:efflux RND transporter periplasmic adaptor subunit [Nitrospirota bacterium]